MPPDDDKTGTFVPLTSGTMVSHYRIIEKIGAGGMGEVYLAEDTALNRNVALKFMPLRLSQDESFRKRFSREAQAAAKLNHPNIVTVYEVSEYQGRLFFAMELVDGRPLKEMIAGHDLSIPQILDLAIQLTDGLQAAHEAGVTHRDIKPSNVVIDKKGRPKLVDFGLASVPGADHLTRTGSTLGTVGYMSPEQVRGEPADHRSDLFSIGVLLYELLTGLQPFRRDSDAATFQAVLHDSPPSLTSIRPDLPAALQRIIDRALAKGVANRYPTAEALLSDLVKVKESLGPVRASAVRSVGSRRWMSRLAVGCVVVGAGVVLLVTQPWKSKTASLLKDSDKIMLAVLPFENLGAAEDEYFVDGMTEEIISRLASVSSLGVISRTSVMGYKKTTKPLSLIGQELGVEYILEGTVRFDKNSSPSKVRITPQLIRVADDVHLWADQVDMPLQDVFQAQTQIARDIVAALDVRLVQDEPEKAERITTHSTEAYRLLLRARHVAFGDEYRGVQKYTMAVSLLQQALELDSSIVVAWAALAIMHSLMYHNAYDQSPERLAQAEAAARRAIQLDPSSPEAHCALGQFYYRCKRDYHRALQEFELAIAAPNKLWDPTPNVAYILRRQGRFTEALERQLKYFRLNPRDANEAGEIAGTYATIREYEKADEFYRKAMKLDPGGEDYRDYVRFVWLWTGDLTAAGAILERCPDRDYFYWALQRYYERDLAGALACLDSVKEPAIINQAVYWPVTFCRATTYWSTGGDTSVPALLEDARQVLEARLRDAPNDFRVHATLGVIYAGLGRREEALEHANQSVDLCPVERDALLGPYMLVGRAWALTRLGEYDRAIDELELLLKMPAGTAMSVSLLKIDPAWDPLRDHLRFQKLVGKS